MAISLQGMRFDRHYILRIGDTATPNGFKIDSSNYPSDMVPQLTFEVKKDTDSNPNETTLVLYNLSADTRAYLDKQNQNAELYAGYVHENEPPLIAKGVVVEVEHDLTSVDSKTTIKVFDGWRELKDTKLSISFEKGSTVQAIIKHIASAMSLPLNISKTCNDSKFKSGFSYSGSPAAALSKLCARAGLKWSIQDGAIQITNLNSNTQRRAITLSYKSGMIGSPKSVKLANRDIDEGDSNPESKRKKNSVTITSTKKERNGYEVTSLLLGQVNPGDLISVESIKTNCNGVYRVETVKHKGDYRNNWTTTLTIAEDDMYNYTYTPL